MTEKKIVKFTVEIECYEETIKSAVTQYQLRQMMGEGFNEATPQERLGLQVARCYIAGLTTPVEG
ncbi:hypothetical protein CL97_gp060 [Cronobacter phage CR9]|uniref:Uncharacterized protein n=1 Tax=Cronobacter phage CR9 TaxID=1162290 RepID=M1F268_9CAUD|nr:hypothetical protein CL97_gp060 [Cronobacter phage CR9]AFH20944.1 hypothetical protein CR9_060 [Cronobacter phage CR9]